MFSRSHCSLSECFLKFLYSGVLPGTPVMTSALFPPLSADRKIAARLRQRRALLRLSPEDNGTKGPTMEKHGRS